MKAPARWLTGQSGWGDALLFSLLGAAMIACIGIIFDSNARDRAEHDATFLRQCAEAGYDAAHCRFWLTATGSGRNNDAAVQMIIQSTTH